MATITSTQVSSIYGANAAPVSTTAASLGGVTNQPATTGGNAAISTGFSSTPAASATTTPAQPTSAQYTQAAAGANNTSVANVNAAANLVSSQFGSQMASDLVTANGGGAISDKLKSGVAGIVAFANQGMQKIQDAIKGEMTAAGNEGRSVDAAKMQLYTMEMSTYELLNQMAAKIQEKQERSVQVWLQN